MSSLRLAPLLALGLLLGISTAAAAPEDAAPRSPEELWASLSPDQVLDEARLRRRVGDHAGAERRLAWLLAGEWASPEARFELGLVRELQEDFAGALQHYDAVLAGAPPEGLAASVAFRRAVVLLDLDRAADGLAEIKAMQRAGDWSGLDALTWELERGVAEVRAGRSRVGSRRLARALEALDGTRDLPWQRSRAHGARIRWMLDEAAAIPLLGDRRAARNLTRRAALLGAAEAEVRSLVELEEPEYILEGLLDIGDAYLALHDDLLAAPPPRKLTEEQVGLYRSAIANQAAVLPGKALRYYDMGVQLAVQTDWQGSVTRRLRLRRDGLQRGE